MMSLALTSLSSLSGCCCPSLSPLSSFSGSSGISSKRLPGNSRVPFVLRNRPTSLRLKAVSMCSQPLVNSRCNRRRLVSSAVICAAMNARCGAEQTQTVTRQSSTITVAPVQGKEKAPELDDGGTGFLPRDDGGGGGGSGGGGWKGGFFLFGFLVFLSFLKDKEEVEGFYSDNSRRFQD